MRPVNASVSPEVSGLRKRTFEVFESLKSAQQSEEQQHACAEKYDGPPPGVAIDGHGAIIEGSWRCVVGRPLSVIG